MRKGTAFGLGVFCVNALQRANAISTLQVFAIQADLLVGVNALQRANAISTPALLKRPIYKVSKGVNSPRFFKMNQIS